MPTILITSMGGAGSNNLVNTIRIFDKEKRYRIIGTHCDPIELAKSSLDDLYVVPKAVNETEYLEAHLSIFERHGVDLLIANSDKEAAVFAKHRDRIPCRHLLPDPRQVEAVQDKFHFYELLRKQGCPVVLNEPVAGLEDLPRAIDKVRRGERFWIRLRAGAGSQGATWLQTPEQARKWIELWSELRGMKPQDFVVAPFLPGRDFCVSTVWQNGELAVAKVYERLSYWHTSVSLSGMGSTPLNAETVGETVPVDRGVEAVQAVCSAFGVQPHGLYQADLKCDDQGNPFVTEINIGRFPMTSTHFDRVGKYCLLELYLKLVFSPEEKLPRGVYDLDPGILVLRGPDMPVKFVSRDFVRQLEARTP